MGVIWEESDVSEERAANASRVTMKTDTASFFKTSEHSHSEDGAIRSSETSEQTHYTTRCENPERPFVVSCSAGSRLFLFRLAGSATWPTGTFALADAVV